MYDIKSERELLKGRTIVVTGAASGLGKCTAYVVAYNGANVALVDLNEAQANETAKLISADFPGCKISVHKCNITEEEAVKECFLHIVNAHTAIHGLAQVAGMFGPGAEVQDTSVSAFEKEMKVNVIGTFLMNKYVVKHFQQQRLEGAEEPAGGWAIVNVGSKASTAGNREAVAYTASKHAQLGISRAVAVEQARNGIRCNCVCPGPVDTPLTRQGANVPQDAPISELNKRLLDLGILDQILLRRLGQPEDIAHQIAYLLGPRAQFVTNTIFEVDGGWI